MSSLLRKKTISDILRDAESGHSDGHGGGLKKVLGVRDLTAFGIAAVIGAGVFSSIGKACYDGGPGVILLYIFTAVACGFAALCYAEFASTVPVSGSAYTYSYVAFGEIFAWIIGWDLLMEYAIGNIAVAISWSDYFTGLLDKAGLHISSWLTMDYKTAHHGFDEVTALVAKGTSIANIDYNVVDRYNAWNAAPKIGSLRLIMDLPAMCIVALITAVVFVGIQESRRMSNIMVCIKLAVIFLVIVLGGYYTQSDNWHPFLPNGMGGVLKGVSAVFFAYIGFDAISTTAEECKNPQRDLPRGMIYSLIICTILYVLLALVLTGMISYTKLNVGDPLALIFENRGMRWIAAIVGVSAIIATASVLLVFQMGQPRIWMSMSRDGLLPKIFSRIHPKYGTPSFSTILTGCVVAIPALFLNLEEVLALTSIGTLFAFVLVCGGILVLQHMPERPASKFRVPQVSGKYIIPVLFILAVGAVIKFSRDEEVELFQNNISLGKKAADRSSGYAPEWTVADGNGLLKTIRYSGGEVIDSAEFRVIKADVLEVKVTNFLIFKLVDKKVVTTASIIADTTTIKGTDLSYISAQPETGQKILMVKGLSVGLFSKEGWPMLLFWIVAAIVAVLSFVKNFSLIPVLGLTSCLYLMAQENHTNWLRFLIWLAVGLVVYFSYSRHNSNLAKKSVAAI